MILAQYLLLSWVIIKSYSRKCTIDDYEKIFTPCNSTTNKRNVIIYKNNNQCDDKSLQNPLLILYSKSPSYQVDCDYKCPPGQILDFNVLENRFYCKKCPKKTYSLGGDVYFAFWNNNILSLFDVNCYIVKNNVKYKNTNCTKAFISQDQKSIVSGKMLDNEPEQYVFELIYSFNAKYDGSIMLQYKKDTMNRDNHLNGEANFFFDYDLIVKDNNSTNSTLFKHYFKKGQHQIAIFYSYWKDYTDRDFAFNLNTFRIEGIEQTSYKCTQCFESISSEESSFSSKCDENSMYSPIHKECIKCPNGTISINGTNCIKKASTCSNFDYELSSVSKCNSNNTHKVIQKLIFPMLCIKNDKNIINTEIPCNDTSIFDHYSPQCKGSNEYYLNNYKLLKQFYFQKEVFDTIIDWKSNGKAMFIPRNPQIKKEMKLEKIINITSHSGYIKLGLNIAKNESIVLSLNDTTELITSNGVYTVNLKQGVYVFQLIYYRKDFLFEKELSIPVELYLLQIVGSSQYNTPQSLCQPCPPKTIAKNSLCIDTDTKSSNTTNSSIKECPVYTHKKSINNNIICVLDYIIEAKKYDIKFNIKPYFEYLYNYCQSHPLCYSNNFIGPLNFPKGPIDISYYFSLFEPKIFVNNYTDDNKTVFNQTGHIFAFASVKDINFKYHHHNRFTFSQALSSTSVSPKTSPILIPKKAVINIGNTIINVKLINYDTESGIVVEYSNREKCRNDPSQYYTSYVYYKCDKTITGFSFPKITHYFYNHCGVVFEVSSPYFCKICSSSELNYSLGKCFMSKRPKIYDDVPTCIFDYLKQDKEYQYDYSIDSQNVLLSTKSKIYAILFSNNHQIKGTLKNKNEDNYYLGYLEDIEGHYLNNRIEYESCDFVHMLESYFYYFILAFGIVYAFVITVIILMYIKYRELKKQNISTTNTSIGIIKTKQMDLETVTEKDKDFETDNNKQNTINASENEIGVETK